MPRYRVTLELMTVRKAQIELEAESEDDATEQAEVTSINDEDIEKGPPQEFQAAVEVKKIG